MSYWRKVLAIAWKDTLTELRTREIVFSVIVFTLLVIVIFNITLGLNSDLINVLAPGILWVTFAFAGVLSMNRAFVPEKEQGCIEGLLACPISRDVIYFGKMLSSLLFMIVVEAVALLVFTLLFNVNVLSPPLILITIVGTIGFATVGTLFSALASNTRARELVLPILFLPIIIPVIIGAVNVSAEILKGGSWGVLAPWLQIILAFDAVFLVISFWAFGFVVEE